MRCVAESLCFHEVPTATALVLGMLARSSPVDYQAPDTCPTRAQIESDLASIPRDEALAIQLEPAENEAWRVRMRLGARNEERLLHAQSCAEAWEAVLVLLRLATPPEHPGIVPLPAPGVSRQGRAPAPSPTETEPKSTEAPPPPRARRRVHAEIAGVLWGGARVGEVPGVAPFGGLGLILDHGRWQWRIGAGHTGTRATRDRTPGARVSLTSATLEGCLVWRRALWSVPGCAVVEVGAMRGIGIDVVEPWPSWRVWANLGLSTGLWWRARTRLRLGLRVAAGAPVVRPTFHASTEGSILPIFAPWRGNAAVMAGIAVDLLRLRPRKAYEPGN